MVYLVCTARQVALEAGFTVDRVGKHATTGCPAGLCCCASLLCWSHTCLVKAASLLSAVLGCRKYDLVVIMIGINDLLRGGSPADDIMAGLQPLFDETLAQGIPIISIPPTAAPGFVAE